MAWIPLKPHSRTEPPTPLHLPPFPICHASNKVILLWWIHIHRRHCQGTCPWMRQGSVQWYQGWWLMFAESSTPGDPGNLRSRGCRGGKCFNKCVFFAAPFSVSCKKCSWWSSSWSKSQKKLHSVQNKIIGILFHSLTLLPSQKKQIIHLIKEKNNITYISTKRMCFSFKHLSPNVSGFLGFPCLAKRPKRNGHQFVEVHLPMCAAPQRSNASVEWDDQCLLVDESL